MQSKSRAMHTIRHWFGQRVPTQYLTYDHLANKSVPIHKFSWAYFLGGLTLVSLLVQIVTGLLLLLYYQPSTVGAYDSVQFITREVPGGLLIRNMHTWSANAMIVFMFFHALTVSVIRAYRKPRELTWLTGSLSLLLVLAMAFSGYLLPWNSLAVYATKVGTQIMRTSTDFLPGILSQIGPFAASLVTGSGDVGQQTLTRFFAFHIAILPLLLGVFVAAHLLFIQVHGMSIPPSQANAPSRSEQFFPTFLLKDAGLWMLFIAGLMILSVVLPYDFFLPYTLLEKYNALAPAPAGIKPEWYFYFLYYPLEVLPRGFVLGGTALFFAALIFFPWLLAGLARLLRIDLEKSNLPVLIPIAVAFAVIVLTFFGPQIVHTIRGVP